MDAATRFYQMAVLIDGEERSSSEVNPVDTPTVYVEVNGRGIQRMTVTLNGMIYAEYSINFKDDTVSQIGEYNFSALTALDPEHGDSWWNGLWGGIGGELFN